MTKLSVLCFRSQRLCSFHFITVNSLFNFVQAKSVIALRRRTAEGFKSTIRSQASAAEQETGASSTRRSEQSSPVATTSNRQASAAEQGTSASSNRHSEQPSPVATTSNSKVNGAQQGSEASSSRLFKLPPRVATTPITEKTSGLSHHDDTFDEDLFRDAVPDEGENFVDNSSSTGFQDTATSSRNVPERDGAASSSTVTSSVIDSNDVSAFAEVVAELPGVVSEKEAIKNLKRLNDHLAAMTIRDHVVSFQSNP